MLGFLSQMQRRVWRLAVRGYSLPEMAIALLVLGILLGGIVVPLSSRLKAEARLKTENLIYDAREAVLGYGIANRTVSGVGGIPIQIRDYNGLPHAMPEGRPYLPCPDVTGDGVEDRITNYPTNSDTFEEVLLDSFPVHVHDFLRRHRTLLPPTDLGWGVAKSKRGCCRGGLWG